MNREDKETLILDFLCHIKDNYNTELMVIEEDNKRHIYAGDVNKFFEGYFDEEGIKDIKESYVSKGGVNKRPTTPRPPPPKGQGV